MTPRSLAVAVVVALSLTGCTETIFESTAGDDVQSCDKQFVGNWQLTASDGNDKGENLFVTVDKDCKAFHFIEYGEGPKEDTDSEKKMHFSFAKVADKPVLMVRLDDDKKSTDANWSDGYHYFLYALDKNVIRLTPVNDERVAQFLLEGKLVGRVEKISRRPGGIKEQRQKHSPTTLQNFVAGDPNDMALAVQMDGLFATDPQFLLKSVTRDDMSKAERKAKSKASTP